MQTTYVRSTPPSASTLNASAAEPASFRPLHPAGTAAPLRNRGALFKSRAANHGNGDRGLIEALVSSKLFQEYERAFTDATGLPVALRPVETWQLPHHGRRNEGPFCSLNSQKSRACASCLSVQETLSELASEQAYTMGCPNGLCDTAVPVRLGDRLIGFLQTGQVFRKKPSEAQFASRVVAPKQHDAMVKLLTIFAQHLSMLSNQVVVQQENAEPPVITRAKEYILEHQTENLRLGHVAKA